VPRDIWWTYHLYFQGRKPKPNKKPACIRWLGILQEILPNHGMRASFLLGWFSTLKMEVISFSETSGHIRTTRRYIPEEGNINNYRCKNLKSYILSESTQDVVLEVHAG
jgi:hypothetical protein